MNSGPKPHRWVWYGSFAGGDPRNFEPDPESSTEEERAKHAADCDAAAAGVLAHVAPAHVATERGFLARAMYGLGINRIPCECSLGEDHDEPPGGSSLDLEEVSILRVDE